MKRNSAVFYMQDSHIYQFLCLTLKHRFIYYLYRHITQFLTSSLHLKQTIYLPCNDSEMNDRDPQFDRNVTCVVVYIPW